MKFYVLCLSCYTIHGFSKNCVKYFIYLKLLWNYVLSYKCTVISKLFNIVIEEKTIKAVKINKSVLVIDCLKHTVWFI